MNKILSVFTLFVTLFSISAFSAIDAIAHDSKWVCEGLCTYNQASHKQQVSLTTEDARDADNALSTLKLDCDRLDGVLSPENSLVTDASLDPQNYCRIEWH